MNYEVDGDEYPDIEEVILCIRAEIRKAKREKKTIFTIDTNSYDFKNFKGKVKG